jgi:hypothetical protein
MTAGRKNRVASSRSQGRWAVLLVALALFAGGRSVRADGHPSAYYFGRFDFEISDAAIRQTPEWTGSGDLPLPPREALRVARAELGKLVGDTSAWNLSELDLSPHRDGRHWVYYVHYLIPRDKDDYQIMESANPVREVVIPVLMNGVAVQPKINPDSH